MSTELPPVLVETPGKVNVASFNKKYRRPFDRKLVDDLKPDSEITWNQHIRGLFTLNQAKCMSNVTKLVTLTDYDTMSFNDKVNEMINGKKMPKYNHWPQYQIDLFNRWISGGYKPGDPVDSTNQNTKIMDPPLPFETDKPPEVFGTNSIIATYNEHIVHIFADSDQRAWEGDFDGESIDSYESFRKVAEDYNKLKPSDPEDDKRKNLVYAIMNNIFPKDQPWQDSWKSVLKNWMKNGYDRGVSSTDAGV